VTRVIAYSVQLFDRLWGLASSWVEMLVLLRAISLALALMICGVLVMVQWGVDGSINIVNHALTGLIIGEVVALLSSLGATFKFNPSVALIHGTISLGWILLLFTRGHDMWNALQGFAQRWMAFGYM
jgi:hypothetical protein